MHQNAYGKKLHHFREKTTLHPATQEVEEALQDIANVCLVAENDESLTVASQGAKSSGRGARLTCTLEFST